MGKCPNSIVLAAILGCAASCGHATPYRTSGSSLSKEGVAIAIVEERCYVNRTTEKYPPVDNEDRLSVGVRLQAKNASGHVAVLSTDGFRLSENIGGEHAVLQPRESGAITLQPGETNFVLLHFEKRGTLDCHHDMTLETDGAIKVDGGQIDFEPIRFLASNDGGASAKAYGVGTLNALPFWQLPWWRQP